MVMVLPPFSPCVDGRMNEHVLRPLLRLAILYPNEEDSRMVEWSERTDWNGNLVWQRKAGRVPECYEARQYERCILTTYDMTGMI
jgi:hypothetical protein